MRIAFLRGSAVVAVVLSFGLTASVDAEEPPAHGQGLVAQPAGAAQDVRVTVVTPEGRHEQSATVARQQVAVVGGGTVTVVRPVAARDEASGQDGDLRPKGPTWQVAAGRRLWLIDPASGDLRTCAVRNTSTVGVEAIRCLLVSRGVL